MAPRHSAYKAAALAALMLCGPALAAPQDVGRVSSDFAQFASQYPELAPPVDTGDLRHPAESELIETLMSTNPGIRDFIDQVKKDQTKKTKDTDLLHRLHSIEVGPNQHPKVHRIALECAAELGLHTDFKVFIKNNPEMTENVFGFPKHGHYGNSFSTYTILLTAGMVKAMSESELKFVIGREMGHVKANHRFYTALAFEFQGQKGYLPRVYPEDKATKMPGLGGLLTFFFQRTPAPSRISEYSADRAGLVAVRNPEAGLSALAKLASGDLEGTPGFDMASYLKQVEAAARDLTERDASELAAGEGYLPFVLNRVSELSRFGQTEHYKALVDKATTNPFLMEIETLFSIGSSLAHWRKRLEEFKADPATGRLDPLSRDLALRDLTAKVDVRAKASSELEEMVVNHVSAAGLASENTLFTDLIATTKRRGDARPFGSALDKLTEQLQFALQQPNLPPADLVVLEGKKAAIASVRKLAPKEPRRPRKLPPAWVEVADLPGMVTSTIATLRTAAEGSSREAFFARLDSLKPELKGAALKIVTTLPVDRRAALAELVASQGGPIAQIAAEVQAAGGDTKSLEALFDRHFDRAREMLKVVPLFMIRRALTRYAGLEI